MHACLRQHLAFSRQRASRISGKKRISNTLSQSNTFGRRWSSNNSDEDSKTTSSDPTDGKTSLFPPFQTPSAGRKVERNIPEGITVATPPTNVLPELPAKPRYPCKHLTDDEVDRFLQPLYQRGWGIFTRLPSKDHPVSTLQLARDISFVWHFALFEFVREMNVIIKTEMHHPKISYEYQVLELRTQTHYATPSNHEPNDETKETRERNIMAGITLRDVRFAYLVERALDPFYELKKIATYPDEFAKLETLSIASQIKVPPARSPQANCIICGENHWATTCPSRFTSKPPLPCEICGGDHWKFACAQYRQWRQANREQRTRGEFDVQFTGGRKRNF